MSLVVNVRLNLFGNAVLTRAYNLPTVFNGLVLRMDPAQEGDGLYNFKLENMTLDLQSGEFRANGFPIGSAGGRSTGDMIDVLTKTYGWKLIA